MKDRQTIRTGIALGKITSDFPKSRRAFADDTGMANGSNVRATLFKTTVAIFFGIVDVYLVLLAGTACTPIEVAVVAMVVQPVLLAILAGIPIKLRIRSKQIEFEVMPEKHGGNDSTS